jgi:uncharacterized protein
MPARTDLFDLGALQLRPGEGRRLDLAVVLGAFELGAERYAILPSPLPVRLHIARMTGGGWSLRLELHAELHGPCMRCLEPAAPGYDVDAREVDQPGDGPDLDSPYVEGDVVDVAAWARDALALALPAQLLCRPDCRGLCPECGIDLNAAAPDHAHDRPPDPRWAALRELQLEDQSDRT